MSVYSCKTYFDCIAAAADIAAAFGRSLDERTVIFCEDKLTLSLEQAVVEKTGGTFNTEVTSFGRYVSKNLPGRNNLSKEGAAMAVKKILSASRNELKTLGRLYASPSFAAETSELIAQLKSAKVSPEDLFGCLDGCSAAAKAKIGDVALIFGKYEEFLKERELTDSSSGFSAMVGAIENDEKLKNSHVVVAGFSSVTKQSREIIETLLKNCRSCDFITVDGENSSLYTSEFADFVYGITKTRPKVIPTGACESGEKILDGLFNPAYRAIAEKKNNVFLFEAKTVSEEADFIARYVRLKVMRGEARYGDIAVGVGDLGAYSLALKRAFSDYGIPSFADEKKPLALHPLARLATDAARAGARGATVKDIRKIVSSSLFISDKRRADDLLRMLAERSVSASEFIDGIDTGDIFLGAKNSVLASFFKGYPKSGTAKTFVKAISSFLKNCGAEENAEIVFSRLGELSDGDERNFLVGADDDFYSVLDEIEDVLGEETVTAEEFYKILAAGVDACDVSLLQRTKDCVFIGNLKDCRYKRYKILFAAGLSGDVPPVKNDVALLSDRDIAGLESLSVAIEPKIRVVNKREKEAAGVALASFSDVLIASYSLASVSGGKNTVSEMAENLTEIFGITPFNSDSMVKDAIKRQGDERDERDSFGYMGIRPALLSLVMDGEKFRNGETDDLTSVSSLFDALKTFDGGAYSKRATELIGGVNAEPERYAVVPKENYFDKTGKISASVIEAFYNCPYSCFLKYGAGLSDSVSPDISAADFGNVLHKTAENFVKDKLANATDEASCKALAETAFDEVFAAEEYSRFLSRPDYAYSQKLLKKEAVKLCGNIYRETKISKFRPTSEEQRFGDGAEYKAVVLPTSFGDLKLSGYADRLDKYGNYVRIVDYKTAHAADKSKDSSFYTGRNLQLYLYLQAFAVGGDKPAGAYYYDVNDKFSKDGEKTPYMYGKTLDDEEVLKATDPNLAENRESEFVEGKKNSLVSADYFDGYMKYAKKMAICAAENLKNGFILATPYEGACSYCSYKALCGRDPETDKAARRGGAKVKSDAIISAGLEEPPQSGKENGNDR